MARQGIDRAAIAEAAYALAEERGLAGLGIRSVAEACGVSVGTDVYKRQSCGSAEPRAWLMERLVEAERMGLVARYPDGRWGPAG